jgi:hypothetical protein
MWRFYSQPITYAGRTYYLAGPAPGEIKSAEVEIEAQGMELDAHVDYAEAPRAFEINGVGYVAHTKWWLVQLWGMAAAIVLSALFMLAYGAYFQSSMIGAAGAIFIVLAVSIVVYVMSLGRRDANKYPIGGLL